MQSGFALYQRLGGMGFKPFPTDEAPHQWIETHPHACFCALLGQLPLPKPTMEGRLQRQLVLHQQGLGIKDPMDFFEEITRHRLLKGILPMELIYSPETLDALAAALVAFQAAHTPDEISFVGSKEEGRIALPVKVLKEKYDS
jgi:predicted RNase H-like nuclease